MTKSNEPLPHDYLVKVEFGHFAELRKEKFNPLNSDENKKCIELEHFNQGTGKINGWTNSHEQKSIKNVFYKGDVLFGKLRPYLCKYWLAEFDGVCSSEVWVLKPKKNISKEYLFNLIQSHNFIQVANVSSGSKMPRADWSYVESFPFDIIKHLPEQQKIARILSTWDKAIKLQQQLIDNKKQYKKAVMKKLLTGEVRFKGFSERWKHIKLGSIIDIGSSKRVLEKDWISKGIPFYRTREIISLSRKEEFRTPIYISEKLFDELKKRYGVPKSDDILVTGVGTIGEMYIVKKSDEFYFKDGNVIWFKMNNKLNSEFLFQQFQIRFIKKQLSDNASITTVSTFTIDGAKKITIKYPCIKEQKKIASFLSGFDNEIKALENELNSFQKQKQGLMQQLLTGKIRVKN